MQYNVGVTDHYVESCKRAGEKSLKLALTTYIMKFYIYQSSHSKRIIKQNIHSKSNNFLLLNFYINLIKTRQNTFTIYSVYENSALSSDTYITKRF